MGCTAGCLNIFLDDEKHIELFADTFVEVMSEHLYEPFEKEDIISFFDTDGDVMFSLDAEPIFSFGHGYEHVQDFLLEFLKKAPDAELDGDFYSDWDNCCDICFMKFEYKDNKLSIMRLFAEKFGMECEECGAEVEMSDVEIDFEKGRCLECPECGARFPQQDDEEYCNVFVDDILLVDGEWVLPEGFDFCTEGDEYLTGIAPDEITNAWKYEDELAEKGVLPDAPKGSSSWDGLPRVHAAAEEGDEKAKEILAALNALETAFAAGPVSEDSDDECDCCDCCEDEEEEDTPEEESASEAAEEFVVEAATDSDEAQKSVQTEEGAETSDETAEIEQAADTTPEKKKSKWWVILLVLAVIAAGAAAVQLMGVYDFIGLLTELFS